MKTKSLLCSFLSLFHITYLFSECSSVLYIPFKSFNPYKDHSYDFFSTIFSNEVYVNLSLSENSSINIKSMLRLDKYSFLLPKDLLIQENDPISPTFNSNLNYTKINYDYRISVANASDIFNFKTYNKTTKKNETINKKLNFLIFNTTISDTMNKYGIIGLKLANKNFDRSNGCFIDNLKKNGLIDNYIWSIRYNIVNETYCEGEIVIGDFLHNTLYYKFYNATDYRYFHPQNEGSDLYWDIYFDKINISGFVSDEYWITNKQASLDFAINVIVGTSDFKRAINKHFFTNYIKKDICYEEHIKKYNDYLYYVCYNDTFDNSSYFSFENFSTINFQHEEFNFALNASDLFIQDPNDKNIFYFLIVFRESYYDYGEEEYWILGLPFMKKYAFSFDPNNIIMGFYTQIRELIIDDKNNLQNYWVYILLGVILFILIGGGVFLFIWFEFNKNKKREIKPNEIPGNNEKLTDDDTELNTVEKSFND